MTHTVKTALRPLRGALVVAGAAIAALAGASAMAGSPSPHAMRTATLDTATLAYRPDALTTHAGRVETFKQLTRAVDRTCNTYRASRGLRARVEMQKCKEELTAALLGEIGDARLSSLNARGPGRVAERPE